MRVFPLTVTCRFAFIVTEPVPIFRACVPVKVKFPFQLWALLLERVTEPAVVLSIVPPSIVKVPLPGAVALFKFTVPALIFKPPEKVLAADKVSAPAPAPAFVSSFDPEITPDKVSPPVPSKSIVMARFKVTVPLTVCAVDPLFSSVLVPLPELVLATILLVNEAVVPLSVNFALAEFPPWPI